MCKKMQKIFLCLVMIICLFPTLTKSIHAEGQNFYIQQNGEKISSVIVEEDGSETVDVFVSGYDVSSYQWQIKQSDDSWVDIYDATDEELTITKALMNGVIDEFYNVYIRCSANVDGEIIYTDSIKASLGFNVDDSSYAVMPIDDIDTDDATVQVIVKYVFEADGEGVEEEAYESNISTLEKGKDYKNTITHPKLPGYQAYMLKDGVYEAVDKLEIDLTNIQEDVIYKVIYKPIEVKYTVRYYLQNIYNDLYVEDASKYFIGSGLTGSYPSSSIEQDFEGFDILFHVPDVIAADGSTEFELYYNREYYLINFDLDGGFGTNPIYARYGTTIVTAIPEKPGYIFGGWLLVDGENVATETSDLPSTMPAKNLTYKAKWIQGDTTYTTVYWLKNSDDSISYLTSKSVNSNSGISVSGYDDINTVYVCGNDAHTHNNSCLFDKTYYEYLSSDSNVLVKGDGSTVVNVYYKPKSYTLRFYYARSIENKYYVVGGTTYPFGWSTSTTIGAQLGSVANDQWGIVENLPTLKEDCKDNYVTGTTKYGNYTYYYLEFTTEYGQNIESLWAIDIFEPVKIAEIHNQCKYEYAYFSGWNGENRVKYTQDNLNGNQTIKGCYMKVDENILFSNPNNEVPYIDTEGNNTSLVCYLGFWDNGANVSWSIPKLFVYNIMVESLDQNDTTDAKEYNKKQYKMNKSFYTYDDSNVENQTAPSIDGLTYIGRNSEVIVDPSGEGMQARNVYFYYDRNVYNLTYYNYGVLDKKLSLQTGASLVDKYYEPSYPSTLEKGAYYFDGWYTTEGCYEGTKADFDNQVMPADNLMLYASWKPLTHSVTFYDDFNHYNNDDATKTVTVTHGHLIETNVKVPVRDGYDFVGWFYFDSITGEKKKFDPAMLPVNRDLKLFGEWTSSIVTTYTLNYVVKDEEGKETKISTETKGYAFAGQTRTFEAKAGEQLFYVDEDKYQSHYYPVTNSHSILMQSNGNENTYTFEYTFKESVNYTVRYIDKETGEKICEPKIKNTTKTAVTEKFVGKTGYLPDSVYKTLVLSANDEDNVITFYYTKYLDDDDIGDITDGDPTTKPDDDEKAYYVVHHKIETEDINGNIVYEDYTTEQHLAKIGDEVEAQDISILGYKVNKTLNDNSNPEKRNKGVVTLEGLELYLYYDRIEYPYIVMHVNYNTNDLMSPGTTGLEKLFGTDYASGMAKYNSTITASASTAYTDYMVVGESTRQLKIKTTEGSLDVANADKITNVLTFYYTTKQAIVRYIPSEGGYVTSTMDTLDADNIKSDNIGSKAVASPYYNFVGWYLDKEYTQPVVTNDIVEVSADGYSIKPKHVENATYYAKFERKVGNLTINRSEAKDDGQVFVYEVKNNENGDLIYVTVKGNTSTTIYNLPNGKYTITQQNSWSWRYNDVIQVVDHNTGKTDVIFDEKQYLELWLNGNSENRFTNIWGKGL